MASGSVSHPSSLVEKVALRSAGIAHVSAGFFHARFFLEMVCRYGRELDEPPAMLPSGWAAVLYLYRMR